VKATYLALALCLLPTREALAAVADGGFSEESVVAGLKQVTSMAWAPDGSRRLFVLEKGGRLLIVREGGPPPAVFATVAPVYVKSECGLLGIAFDPRFEDNHFVYLFVSVSATEQQIVRYVADGDVGTQKTVLLAGLPTRGLNHDGGALGFGPDGKLYWAIGDNAGERSGVDADLASLAAKVGRANPDGTVPADNPFVDGDGSNNDYIWARGFRNPFTLKFQPTTGRLWLNVVGGAMEQVFVPVAGDHGGWDDYEGNQPSGFLTPVISYWTNKAPAFVVGASGATRAAGVVTLTTTVHRLRPGASVTVAGMADVTFNGDAVVSSVGPRTLSFAQSGADGTSGGGTVTPAAIGGSLVGGEFLDTSGVPLPYRQSFVFADYNTGVVMRAELSSENVVRSIQPFASGFAQVVDLEMGPDGALYVASYGGSIARVRYTPAKQALIVAPLNLRVAEGAKAKLNVSLAQEPAGEVTVRTARVSGDADVSVAEGKSLVFNADNWAVPQLVSIEAAVDTDSLEDSARLRVASSGLESEEAVVRVTDADVFSVILSPSSLSLEEGGESASFTVALTQAPKSTREVTVSRSSGDPSVVITSGQRLTFDTENWSTPQMVEVEAAPDDDSVDGVTELVVEGQGLEPRTLRVETRDDEMRAPRFTSAPLTTAIVGVGYRYEARATGFPPPAYSLGEGPRGMNLDAKSGVVSWLPSTPGSAAVTLSAENGVEPGATQTFGIEVTEDLPPSCSLTAPRDGALISGEGAEFFGDVEDATPVRAEFSIDGEVAYVDENSEGHYHFGGEHALFDTTRLEDGPHALAFRGYDATGASCVVEVNVTVKNGSSPSSGGAGGEGADGSAGLAPLGGVGSVSAGEGDAGAQEPSEAGSGSGAPSAGCGCQMAQQRSALPWVFALGGAWAALGARRRTLRSQGR
jgi:glucose/arabinose dehydrogenase